MTVRSGACPPGVPRPKLVVDAAKMTDKNATMTLALFHALDASSSFTVRGIDLDGGLARPCFGVYLGNLTLIDVNCARGAATWGGGVTAYQAGPITVVGGSFTGCFAVQSGGAMDLFEPTASGAIKIVGTTFSRNLVMGEAPRAVAAGAGERGSGCVCGVEEGSPAGWRSLQCQGARLSRLQRPRCTAADRPVIEAHLLAASALTHPSVPAALPSLPTPRRLERL